MMREFIEELGDSLPQAFFVANDALATGALRALQEAKIPVPERISLISFNDTSLAKYIFPKLLQKFLIYIDSNGKTSLESMLKRWYNKLNLQKK